MKAILNRYFFVMPYQRGIIERLTLPGWDVDSKPVVAIGEVSGKELFVDGLLMETSPIVEHGEDFIKTESGSYYHLGEPHPEFKEYIENRDKLVKNWILSKTEEGYYLIGQEVTSNKMVHGLIVSQNGNWVTFKDGTEKLVIWRNMDEITRFQIMVTQSYLDMKYPDQFGMSTEAICRPIITN